MGLFRVFAYVLEITALGVIVCLSLTTVVVMGLLKGDFDGHCPLYPQGDTLYMHFYQPSNCNFVIGMHSVALLIAIAAGAYRAVELIKRRKLVSSAYIPFMFVVSYLIVAVLIMATACLVTVGFNKLCKEFVNGFFPFYDNCKDFQSEDTFNPPVDASHFYDYLLVAETTAWLSFCMWLFLAGLTALICTCFQNKM